MIYLGGFYVDPHPARMAEIVECLERNVAHPAFTFVDLLLEDPGAVVQDLKDRYNVLRDPKVVVSPHSRRSTFQQRFEHAARRWPGEAVVTANSDIYFDETLELLGQLDLSARFLCLTRHERSPEGALDLWDVPYSQDAWVFRSPLPYLRADFLLGLPGCDNRIAYEAHHAGLMVSNPARSVRAIHVHGSGIRHYRERSRLRGGYLNVAPVTIDACMDPTTGSAVQPSPLPGRETPRRPVRERGTLWARVGFREAMGYRVLPLAAGESSHTNDVRPIRSVPDFLNGCEFTQVVAGSASAVDLEFLGDGTVGVFVGTDWSGARLARRVLRSLGARRTTTLLETERNTAFELHLLTGRTGERVRIPTQVMLVGESLSRQAEEGRGDEDLGGRSPLDSSR